ncbi:hypothetical protein RHSIM_Rhsim05G0103500 [Rhododendron simsii]|uniref:Uncharacterized protein n=1 Tax=Rhododendron simsii TaxID=118357 RepID=A0A834H0B8_RHOSS|nr:hypothetical protein RHSIM_Rhsim05G0103500 [Rhododendron simsii]
MQIMVWDCYGHTEKEIISTVRAFVYVHNPGIVVLVGAPNIEKRHKKFGPLGHMRFTDVHSMHGGSHGDVLVAIQSYSFEIEPHWHDGNGFDVVISHTRAAHASHLCGLMSNCDGPPLMWHYVLYKWQYQLVEKSKAPCLYLSQQLFHIFTIPYIQKFVMEGLEEGINACVDAERSFGVDIINNIPTCYMISVGYKVKQVSINVKVPAPPHRISVVHWVPQYYKVGVHAKGSIEERENAIRSIMGWNDDAILPYHENNGSFDIVVYCCGIGWDKPLPNINDVISNLVGMVNIDLLIILQAPYPIETHREFLTTMGFVGQHAVEGAIFVSGNALFLYTGKNVKVEMEVHENEEINVTMTRKGYERHVVNMLQRKKKGKK